MEIALTCLLCRFLNPVVFGHYPLSMRNLVKDRLPVFTEAQSSLVKASADFIGINYYSTYFAANYIPSNKEDTDFYSDMKCSYTGSVSSTLNLKI